MLPRRNQSFIKYVDMEVLQNANNDKIRKILALQTTSHRYQSPLHNRMEWLPLCRKSNGHYTAVATGRQLSGAATPEVIRRVVAYEGMRLGVSRRKGDVLISVVASKDMCIVRYGAVRRAISYRKKCSMFKFHQRHNLEEPNITVTDEELIELIRSLSNQNPTCGRTIIRGHLLSLGIRASEKKVMAALRIVNPEAVEERQGRRLYRRVYSVPCANYLWHIDGNHKLVTFNFVIHGCIDGYSRRVIFLECNTNNRASTVLNVFSAGVELCGLPHRVRPDRGCENGLVRDFMRDSYGEKTRFIQGPSVHNTRIERLWRDVNEKVTRPFKEIFVNLEMDRMLDETNLLDIFCLHFVFLFRVQESLCQFVIFWNNHCFRMESMQTPNQMWLVSMLSENACDTVE